MNSRAFTKAGILISICAAMTSVTGCGQSDAAKMAEYKKKYAIKRPKDEDDAPAISRKANENFKKPERGASPGATPAAPAAPPTPQATGTVVTSTTAAPAATPVAAAPAKPELTAGTTSDTKSPPATPLSEEERRQITINNMTRIAKAFEAYRASKGGGAYLPQYISDSNGQPLLSWRVALLPYLGYQELYNEFRTNERFDSAHNEKLIAKIPSVYQSPERFDTYTNYLVPTGGSAAFGGPKPKPIRRWEDGLANTIILVEVNGQGGAEDKSVLWTQPVDMKFHPMKARESVGKLRSDGFFAVWGGGELSVVPGGLSVRGAFTTDAGDTINSGLKKPAMASLAGISSKFRRGGAGTSAPVAGSVGNPANVNSVSTTPISSTPSAGRASGPMVTAAADAQTAFNAGREADAIQLYYANIATSDQPGSWQYQYQWVPGLKRPAAIVRYGLAVEFKGPNAKRARAAALKALYQVNNDVNASFTNPRRRPQTQSRQGVVKVYEKVTGNFGQRILKVLKDQPLHAPFTVEAPELVNQNRYRRRDDDDDIVGQNPLLKGARLAPGVQFIGIEPERKLIAAARKNEVDVLLVFNIEEKSASGGGALIREVSVSVIDVLSKKTLYKTKELNSRKVQAAKIDIVADDPTPRVVDDFEEFIVAKFSPGPIPAIKPRSAANRVAKLAKTSDRNPLRSLAEIQLYRHMGLIDLPKQMAAYKSMLDETAALTLIGGSPDEKVKSIKGYLPRIPDPPSI